MYPHFALCVCCFVHGIKRRLMIWSMLDPIFTLSALILFPIGSNVILLVLIKDYVPRFSSV